MYMYMYISTIECIPTLHQLHVPVHVCTHVQLYLLVHIYSTPFDFTKIFTYI